MIAAGLQLMVLGMSVVFVFLIVLVLLMFLTSAVVRRLESLGTPAALDPSASAEGAPAGSPHIAAVLAAVATHHRRRS